MLFNGAHFKDLLEANLKQIFSSKILGRKSNLLIAINEIMPKVQE